MHLQQWVSDFKGQTMEWRIGIWAMLLVTQANAWTHVASNVFGWKTKELVFHVNTQNCTIPDTDLFDILDAALNAWNGISFTNLTLKRSSTLSTTTVSEFLAGTATDAPLFLCDPNLTTHIGDANNIPGVTVRTALDGEGHIIYSGILLNAESTANAELSKLSRGQIELTLAHEVGHVLGLGHSSTPEALMYYSLGNKEKAVVTSDDMDGIAHLYPRSEFSGGSFGCSAVHATDENPNRTWFFLGVLFLFGNFLFARKIVRRHRQT